ncbi:potential E3 ubiquitin-protein ligase ariadne-2-like [Heptranchias perlo]|uniref:potential E3 ubiquitin-protein ligase ariadne-2-like n=1 Tax=Heptranchias perlo TaxID=212740 RepID=UPI00355ABAC8
MTTEKQYDPKDFTLKFVKRKDDITEDDDPDVLRAEMSCGHAVDPNSLTGWCRHLLSQGNYRFTCPATKAGTVGKCGKEWSYPEVRRMALLTDKEREYFEETAAVLASAEYCILKPCPGCGSFTERENVTKNRVNCAICTTKTGSNYRFCWQCLGPWKCSGNGLDACGNSDCVNVELERLKSCPMVSLPNSEIKSCPLVRACPTCGLLIEHTLEGCKYVVCLRCKVEFCFACLEIGQKCMMTKSGSYYKICAKDVAPRQSSIPLWTQLV